MQKRIYPFTDELCECIMEFRDCIDIIFDYNKNGHDGMSSKDRCLAYLDKQLNWKRFTE